MDKFCCILYGESGVGKTPFAGTLQQYEKTSPCLLLDVDQGAMSLTDEDRPIVVPIEKWEEVQRIQPFMKAKEWEKLAAYISELVQKDIPTLEYKSVVIDSGTELEYKLRSSIVGPADEIPSQPEYLKTQERFRRMYRHFRDLDGMSLVLVAGVRELKDDVAGIIKHYPAFQPNLGKDLIRMTDLILFMNVSYDTVSGSSDRKWVKYIQASLTQRAIARDRSGKLDSVMKQEKFYWKDILPKILD